MPKHLIILLILFVSLPIYNLHQYYDEYPDLEGNYDDYDLNDDNYFDNFNETLKNYLVDNGYFDSDRIIEPHEMKKIIYEVITEGEPDRNSEEVNNIFKQLAERFTEVYFNDKKQIKGKDIYGIVNIDDIWSKFNDYLDYNTSGLYDDYDDDGENDDLDDDDSIFMDDL